MQQLTCNIGLSISFYYLFFSFVLIEPKDLCFEGESPGGKILKKCEKVRKKVKIMKRFCPLVVALQFFPDPCFIRATVVPRGTSGMACES